ncbi:serine/threonine-protein kinase STY13-like [Lycium ferocissimum]|uniref:serine/threonine-protein kinase STY13-like n=1 Tax=Lycium ferocissimum TaxID=112874 RepID=UPI002814E179|nr:serine/threonine-protein kinase STY13-like [Lycium ferocissimum]
MAKTRTRAEIDLKRMDEQLERQLDRMFSDHKGCEESKKVEVITNKEEWKLDPNKKLKVNNLIGQGAYGSVYKGLYDGKEVAVKILDMSNEKRRAVITKAFTQEVSIWYKLDHPNIAKIIGASKRLPQVKPNGLVTPCNSDAINHSLRKQSFGYAEGYCIVVEYVSGGTLTSHLLKHSIKRLPLNSVIQLALDVARGLSYLHSKKIVHRDVKSWNLLVDKKGRVKIIDFGVSRVEASCPIDMTAQTGTVGYMAPEVLAGLPYDHKCDVYSYGICLWEIYCCSIAYPSQITLSQTSPTIYKSRRPEIPNSCPNDLANIMKQCWDANPKKRPEMQEVVLMLEAIDTSEAAQNESRGCFCLTRRKRL